MEVSGSINYKVLNYLLKKIVETNSIDKDSMNKSEKISAKLLKKKYLPTETSEFSRSFSLNEVIDIVYKFLDSFDHDMAIQYDVLIHQKLADGTPAVKFIDGKYNPDAESLFNGEDEIQFVFYGDPIDITTLLHEMIHMMNHSPIIREEYFGSISLHYDVITETKRILSEVASITFELLLNDYLLENGYINENDYNLIYNDRLDSTKADAEEIIVKSELIKLYLRDGHIDFINLTNLLNSRDRKSMIGQVLRYEYRYLDIILDALDDLDMSISEPEKYVLGLTIADEIIKGDKPYDDALWIHNELGDPNSELCLVAEDLERDYSIKIR